MAIELVQVDAFTREPFSGNPAAVCVLPAWPDADWMQAVAAEMNLAETAFVVPQGNDFGLRWFTPAVEVDLCGHATVASAHVLWENGTVASDAECRFHTRSGLLKALRDGDRIAVDFPLHPVQESRLSDDALRALGVEPVATFENARLGFAVIELEDAAAVRAAAPNFAALRGQGFKGYIVTASSEEPYDFVSRLFAPDLGIDEDPVTGAAHCILGSYWSPKLGRSAMRAYQVSARGGEVGVELLTGAVRLYGDAVTVLRATLTPAAEPPR
jgi:PhzF family phenazine biosynthesis protein